MTIEEGLQLPQPENGRIEIPDCGRDDLPGFFARNGLMKGAEIGVYKGAYTQLLIDAGLTVYGVDPFMAFDDYDMPDRDFQGRQDHLAHRIYKRFNDYPNFTFIRKTSMDACKDFPRDSLDWVYIDGHHGFKYVAEDLWEWTKVVKPGGYICGHDYTFTVDSAQDPCILHVRHALDAFLEAKKIRPLYILGEKYSKPGEKRDKWRSWMFVNPPHKTWCNRELAKGAI